MPTWMALRPATMDGLRCSTASAGAPALAGRSPPAWPRAALPFRPWPADVSRHGGTRDESSAASGASRGAPGDRSCDRWAAPTTTSTAPPSDRRRALSRTAAALDARRAARKPAERYREAPPALTRYVCLRGDRCHRAKPRNVSISRFPMTRSPSARILSRHSAPTDARVSVPALPCMYACVACFLRSHACSLQTLIALCASQMVAASDQFVVFQCSWLYAMRSRSHAGNTAHVYSSYLDNR